MSEFENAEMEAKVASPKLPPQLVEFEEALLGGLLLEKEAIEDVVDILKPESFYHAKHGLIYDAICSLRAKTQPIDVMSVTQELKKAKKLNNVGGATYLMGLTQKVSSSAHAEFQARAIAEKFIQRQLITISNEILKESYDDSVEVDELLNNAERKLFEISEGTVKKEAVRINAIMDDAIDQIKAAAENTSGISGVPSGFTVLDSITSGWQNTDLIIVAARPSMGKTAFVVSMCRNMAVDHNRPVAIFSLEMSNVQIVTRMIVSETNIPNDTIKNGTLSNHEWEQLSIQTKKLYDAPMYIDDTPSISLSEFRSKCRRLKAQQDIELVVVDYLQLMTTGMKSGTIREQEVSLISRTLKAIAKELEIPIIALSQLSRGLETRSADKKPQLSDLRESGAIEQDADIVMFINRPERYGLDTDEDGRPMAGMADIIIAKHRNGAIGEVWLHFQANGAKFMDLAPETNRQFNLEHLERNQQEFTAQSSMGASGAEQIGSFESQIGTSDPLIPSSGDNSGAAPF